ncbi:MAG: PaaI family thioesterase [Rhodobacteraceae bacterium]|nr:PaaI family thioesterase [Paracoccaceae bacterium]
MTRPRIARTPEEMHRLEDLAGLTGLQIMRAMLEGRLSGPPIAATLDYRLHAVDEGRVEFRGAPAFGMLNPMGSTHGGWYGTLLDSAMGCAVMTRLPAGRGYTTLEYKINILRAVPLGMEMAAIGESRHAGRSTGVADGRIVGVEDGKLYALGSTTCLVLEG